MPKYARTEVQRCPYCLTTVRLVGAEAPGGAPVGGVTLSGKEDLHVTYARCPTCEGVLVTIETGTWNGGFEPDSEHLVWPLHSTRPVPNEVPSQIAADYKEAASVLSLSPKASAALSRRCLQALLRDAAGAKQHDLAKQIDAVMPGLPHYIANSIDAVRNIGNFAAHPLKDTDSGLIVEVEPGEAEWNLDVLDMLFDHYYVKPAEAKHKRDALNAKLQAADKPAMKQPKGS